MTDYDDEVRSPDEFARMFTPAPWVERAACRGLPVELFFPERNGTTVEAKATCASCPVQTECLELSMEGPEKFGVWGGMSERQRKVLRPIRNAALRAAEMAS